jgi:hypothetical protein
VNVKPSNVPVVAELRRAGMSCRDIALKLGLGLATVYVYSAQAGIVRPPRPPKPPGSRNIDERPAAARARVQREVAEGKRCRTCCLLLPCADHQP